MTRKVFLVLFILGFAVIICDGQTREFYRSVLDDPERAGSHRLIGLNVEIGDRKVRAVIQNGELAHYLKTYKKVGAADYVTYVTDLLMEDRALAVRADSRLSSNFIPVEKIERVETTFKKGIADLIKFYFEDGGFRAKINHDSQSTNEMYVVADKLFTNGIATYESGPTGLIVLSTPSTSSHSSGTKGTVMDSFGALVPGAKVIATGRNGERYETTTNIRGEYQLNMPDKGIFKIQIIARPFKTFTIDEYQLVHGGTLNLDVSLICEDCETLSLPFKPSNP